MRRKLVDADVYEKRLLAWVQRHDWGRDAFLTGDGAVGGIVEGWTFQGVYDERIISLPANLTIIRAWAGY